MALPTSLLDVLIFINKSIGASLFQAGRKAGLSPGDVIREIIFEAQ